MLSNGPAAAESVELPLHAKNPAVGTKQQLRSSSLWLDQADAQVGLWAAAEKPYLLRVPRRNCCTASKQASAERRWVAAPASPPAGSAQPGHAACHRCRC